MIVGKNVATVPRLECVLTVAPPLIATGADVERIVVTIDKALQTVSPSPQLMNVLPPFRRDIMFSTVARNP